MVNILVVISTYAYASKISEIVKDAEKIEKKPIYVSLNKTYKSLTEKFKNDNVDVNKYFFIDTISATIITPKQTENCLFLTAPEDVNQLYEGIINTVKTKNADMVIFDSLSSLATYNNTNEIIHFVTNLLGALSLLNCSAIFTCLQGDEDKELIRHIKMKVDKVYELS